MPPTSAASTTRGARSCQRIASCTLVSGECTCTNGRCESADSTIAPTPMPTGPTPSPTRSEPTRNAPAQSARRGGDAARLDARLVRARTESTAISERRATAATARANSTMRGPQREATLVVDRDDALLLHGRDRRSSPGAPATVARDCPQQIESASTTMSGFDATMYSAESCG